MLKEIWCLTRSHGFFLHWFSLKDFKASEFCVYMFLIKPSNCGWVKNINLMQIYQHKDSPNGQPMLFVSLLSIQVLSWIHTKIMHGTCFKTFLPQISLQKRYNLWLSIQPLATIAMIILRSIVVFSFIVQYSKSSN